MPLAIATQRSAHSRPNAGYLDLREGSGDAPDPYKVCADTSNLNDDVGRAQLILWKEGSFRNTHEPKMERVPDESIRLRSQSGASGIRELCE